MAGAMVAWIAELHEHRQRISPQATVPSRAWHSPGLRLETLSLAVSACLTPLTVACAVLAISPDFDNFFHTHRTYSHSVGASGLIWLGAALIAWRLRLPVVRTATVCAAAYASHMFLDWLGRDDSAKGGLMALWPLTTHYYRSGANLFLELAPHPRYGLVRLLISNARALAREVLILGPPFLLALALRVRSMTRALRRATAPDLKVRRLRRA
jgi:membrane-bound metal-dependent hydrolase YbcI (DUF457 family)